MTNDNTFQYAVSGLTRVEYRRRRRSGVRVWQQEKKKLRAKVDPFVILVFLYLIFSISCLLWFGWKYYELKREVAGLSEIAVTLYEEKAAEPTTILPEQKEPADNPLSTEPTATGQPDTAASPAPAISTTYTVMEGDSWEKISEYFYGTRDYCLKLPAYNQINDQSPYSGLVVKIPPREVLDALQ